MKRLARLAKIWSEPTLFRRGTGLRRAPPATTILLVTAAALVTAPLTARMAKVRSQVMEATATTAVAENGEPERNADISYAESSGRAMASNLAAIAPNAGPDTASLAEVDSCLVTTTAEASPSDLIAEIASIAQELKDRRKKLRQREDELQVRAAALDLLKAAIEQQSAELASFASATNSRKEEISAEERARIDRVVKIYDAMKAKAVAAIFDQMPIEQLSSVAAKLREPKLAAIVAEMNPDKSRQLMQSLSKR